LEIAASRKSSVSPVTLPADAARGAHPWTNTNENKRFEPLDKVTALRDSGQVTIRNSGMDDVPASTPGSPHGDEPSADSDEDALDIL